MLDEATLLERVVQCDTEALAHVYDHYHDRIYRYIYGYLGRVDAAEDLTANVFFRLLNAVQRGKSPRKNLSAWLYRVAHNLVVDTFRRMPPEELELAEWLESDQPEPAQTVEQRIQLERIRLALQHLTDGQHDVIMLKFFVGMDSHEIGTIMGKSEGAVDALQHRALRALRKILNEGRGPGEQDASASEKRESDAQQDAERDVRTSIIGALVPRRLLALMRPPILRTRARSSARQAGAGEAQLAWEVVRWPTT